MKNILIEIFYGMLLGAGIVGSFSSDPSREAVMVGGVIGSLISVLLMWKKHGKERE